MKNSVSQNTFINLQVRKGFRNEKFSQVMKYSGIFNKDSVGTVLLLLAGLVSTAGCGKHAPENRMVLPAPTGAVLSLFETDTLLLSWEPVSGASHYNIYLEDGDGNSVEELTQISETSGTVPDVETGKSYSFRVRAVNGYDYSDFTVSNTIDVPLVETPDTGTDTGTTETKL